MCSERIAAVVVYMEDTFPPVHSAATVGIDLHEQLRQSCFRQACAEGGTQLLIEAVRVQLPAFGLKVVDRSLTYAASCHGAGRREGDG